MGRFWGTNIEWFSRATVGLNIQLESGRIFFRVIIYLAWLEEFDGIAIAIDPMNFWKMPFEYFYVYIMRTVKNSRREWN